VRNILLKYLLDKGVICPIERPGHHRGRQGLTSAARPTSGRQGRQMPSMHAQSRPQKKTTLIMPSGDILAAHNRLTRHMWP
jgi:hypothetical protein